MKRAFAIAALALAPGCRLGLDNFGGLLGDTAPDGDADIDTDSDTDVDTGGSDADTDTDTDSDTDADLLDLDVDSVDPWFGSDAGGTEVTIEGGPFDDSARVWFGNSEGTVQSVAVDRIIGLSSSGTDDTWVDVKVETDTRTGTLDDAFFYLEDASGQAGAFGYVEWYHYNGGYWKDGVDWGMGAVTFTPAHDYHYWDWFASSLGSCEREYEASLDLYYYDTGASSIELTAGAASMPLPWSSGDGWFVDEELAPSAWVDGASYDLEEFSTDEFPEFSVSGFLETPDSFAVSSPSIDSAGPPRVSGSPSLRWSGGGGSAVIVQAGMLNTSGTAVTEWVSCAFNDTGSATLSSSNFTSWTSGRVVILYVGRVIESGATLPHNNGESRVAGVYWNVGAFEIQ